MSDTLPGKPVEEAIAEKEAAALNPREKYPESIRTCVRYLNKLIEDAEKTGCEVRLTVIEFDGRTLDDASMATKTGARLEVRVFREE